LLDPACMHLIDSWSELQARYNAQHLEYKVRGRKFQNSLRFETISGTSIKKIFLPRYHDWGDRLRWLLQENVPGQFPFTSGVFELKRTDEDPTRMFAGEGGPARTNRRFHYLSEGQPAIRLSTAFDSVTLYGEDPDERPDIFGKIGNAGVSIATLDDMKVLYRGFDLCAPNTSVSMTINGPAPIVLAFFLNAAIDQQVEKHKTHEPLDEAALATIRANALASVRGTVQADILKEDQAQNTCIFSIEFALKMMGDVQEYFIRNNIRNFYSVSISGYHIAEAGANPITQLAFTLSNGFTYLEYYLSRGMHVDEFAPNLSFFFSNGMDAEYSVIGRVARRIWAKAIKYLYKGNERSQKLKYHIQTSGRSLHAQEIDFNDIRTTLQALYAIYDNCNSLHTNAYDEAITTPTEESVRRAMAIQLIINKELGTAKSENAMQGSFLIEELTELVEEAVLVEFERLNQRGGVLGAMERMYQRNRIQEESLRYEHLKHTGDIPVVGVNTFLDKGGSRTIIPAEVIRSTNEEKHEQVRNVQAFKKRNETQSAAALQKLKTAVLENKNIFEELMSTARCCSLGQITHALYEVGGQYRRNM
jgi:methylmalonyl-CoA mutase